MKTYQLNARIEEKAYHTLMDLTAKLHTTKAHLTEKAIYLLKEHFEKIDQSVGSDRGADVFLSLLSKNGDKYHELYEKLSLGATFMSESSLKKDWLTPEEDEAWKNL